MNKSPRYLLSESGKFAKSSRVRRRGEFLRIQRTGIRVHTLGFTVVANKGHKTMGPRLGCAVSKRVGNAVVRSRVRRLIRESFRRLVDQLSPVDFVVIAKPQAAECASDGLHGVVDNLGSALITASRRVSGKEEGRPRSW